MKPGEGAPFITPGGEPQDEQTIPTVRTGGNLDPISGGEQPVDGAESIRTSQPAPPDAMAVDGHGNPVAMYATAPAETPTDPNAAPSNRRRNVVVIAGLSVAALVAAGATYFATRGSGSTEAGHPKSTSTAAGFTPGAHLSLSSGPSVTETTPTAVATSAPESVAVQPSFLGLENKSDQFRLASSPVNKAVLVPGRLDPSNSIDITWNGRPTQVNSLPKTNSNPNALMTGAMSLLDVTLSLDPNSAEWHSAVLAFTDNPLMIDKLRAANAAFHRQHPGFDEQFMLFTTDNAPATAVQQTDANGNPVITTTGGTVYARRLVAGAKDKASAQAYTFGDVQAYSVGDAVPVSVSFTYHGTNVNGLKVTDFSLEAA